jgi:hypothetical protein
VVITTDVEKGYKLPVPSSLTVLDINKEKYNNNVYFDA